MIHLDVDVVKYQGGHLVNTKSSVGKPINGRHILQYEDTLSGKFEGTHEERDEYFDRALSLCYITVGDSRKEILQGSCWQFWDKGWCLHAAAVQFQSELAVAARPIMNKKRSTYKRVARGDQDRKRFREQVRENKKEAINHTFLEEVAAIKERNKEKILLMNRVLNGATVIGGEESPAVDDNPSEGNRDSLSRKQKNVRPASKNGVPTSFGKSPQPKRINKEQIIDLSNKTSLSQSVQMKPTNWKITNVPNYSSARVPMTTEDQGQAVIDCTNVSRPHLDVVRQTATPFNRCSLLLPHVAHSNEVPRAQIATGSIHVPSSMVHPGLNQLLNLNDANQVPAPPTEVGDCVLSGTVHFATHTNNGNASSGDIAFHQMQQGSNMVDEDVMTDQCNGQLWPFHLLR